jgi:hypothetical protein
MPCSETPGCSGPSPGAVALETEEQDRPVILSREARGRCRGRRGAAGVGLDDHRAVASAAGLFRRARALRDDAAFETLALGVARGEVARDLFRLDRVARLEERKREVRRVDGPAAFRRGPIRNATSSELGAASAAARPGEQRAQSRRPRRGQRRQAEGGDDAVLALQRHEVRDGAQARGAQQRLLESETPARRATACAIFMAMAEAASSLYGYGQPGCFGLTTIAPACSSSGTRW